MRKKLRDGRTSLGLQLFPFCILGLPQLSLSSGWCGHLLFIFPPEVAVLVLDQWWKVGSVVQEFNKGWLC